MLIKTLIFVTVTILIIVALKRIYKKNLREIGSVKAGPTGDMHANQDAKTGKISIFDNFYYDNKKVNPKDYIVCRVDGSCMAPKGVKGGDIVFIHEYGEDEKKQISQGEILYIKYEKCGVPGYKLREFVGYTEDGDAALTRYYSNEELPKDSSAPHKIDNICGVVQMRFN